MNEIQTTRVNGVSKIYTPKKPNSQGGEHSSNAWNNEKETIINADFVEVNLTPNNSAEDLESAMMQYIDSIPRDSQHVYGMRISKNTFDTKAIERNSRYVFFCN